MTDFNLLLLNLVVTEVMRSIQCYHLSNLSNVIFLINPSKERMHQLHESSYLKQFTVGCVLKMQDIKEFVYCSDFGGSKVWRPLEMCFSTVFKPFKLLNLSLLSIS